AVALPPVLTGVAPALSWLGLDEATPVFVTALARFGLTSALLVVPAAAMGATFPLLAEALAGGAAGSIGWLYGAHVAGGVVGAAGAGFVLLPALGVSRTNLVAAGLNLVAGLGGLWVDRRGSLPARATGVTVRVDPTLDPEAGLRLARVLAGLVVTVSGALAMLYEVAWSRDLPLVLGSSAYAFTVLLPTWPLRLSGGSSPAGPPPAHPPPGPPLRLPP